jgi:hypothetical protein
MDPIDLMQALYNFYCWIIRDTFLTPALGAIVVTSSQAIYVTKLLQVSPPFYLLFDGYAAATYVYSVGFFCLA